jgi:hypothetical protein
MNVDHVEELSGQSGILGKAVARLKPAGVIAMRGTTD